MSARTLHAPRRASCLEDAFQRLAHGLFQSLRYKPLTTRPVLYSLSCVGLRERLDSSLKALQVTFILQVRLGPFVIRPLVRLL